MMIQWRRFRRFITAAIIAVLPFIYIAMPVSATYSDPNSIALISQKAFRNVFVSGDMLFFAYYNVGYVTPPSENPDTLFYYNLYDTDGTTLLYTRGINYYQSNVIAIYLTAAQASSLTWGAIYTTKIVANPSVVASLVEGTNMVTRAFDATDWIDGTLNGTTPTYLLSYLTSVMGEMKVALESLTIPIYITSPTINGDVLNYTGSSYFLAAISNLSSVVPDLFQVPFSPIVNPAFTASGALQNDATVSGTMGATVERGVSQLGIWLGMSHNMAGGIILMAICLVVMVMIFRTGGSTSVAMVLVVPMLLIGAWSGLLPIALLFTVGILVAAYMLYALWLRGV